MRLRAPYRPGELSLVFYCLEISDRAKYAGWNDLDDMHDLDHAVPEKRVRRFVSSVIVPIVSAENALHVPAEQDLDAQQGRKDSIRFIKSVSVGEIAIMD